MIQVHINPAKVERVLFVAESETEENFDFAVWQVIRPLVEQIDQRLGKLVGDLAKKRAQEHLSAAR